MKWWARLRSALTLIEGAEARHQDLMAALDQRAGQLLGNLDQVGARLGAETARRHVQLREHIEGLAVRIDAADRHTAAEVALTTQRLERLSEQFAHLTAQLVGKRMADQIEWSRGPREFTSASRQ